MQHEENAMITLHGGGPNFGLPEISPYVTKTEVQLKMAGLAYEKHASVPMRSPKGQIPFIEDDGEFIADSTFIRAHIERKYGVDLDECLDGHQRAQAWRSEEHTSELQSLMRISYAVFCLQKKN